jgi:hypothetical protein
LVVGRRHGSLLCGVSKVSDDLVVFVT